MLYDSYEAMALGAFIHAAFADRARGCVGEDDETGEGEDEDEDGDEDTDRAGRPTTCT